MKKLISHLAAIVALACLTISPAKAAEATAKTYDVVVYGGTPGGLAAAIQASRMGKSTIVLEPEKWIGGMMTGGLGASDKGVYWTVGGLARDFFENVYTYYSNPAVWKRETREGYLPKHGLIYREDMKCQWFFEPHVARAIFDEMLATAKVPVHVGEHLNRATGVAKEDGRITSITMLSGLKVKGRMFIDATYEGDLMAAAGVDFTVGRESNAQYGETINGLKERAIASQNPFVVDGDPKSGLLPRIAPKSPGEPGAASPYVQAYNFRLCLTDQEDNRVAFAKPENYNPLNYELLLRSILSRKNLDPQKGNFTRVPMPNLKTDTNNTGMISTDYIGGQFDWPTATYAEREKILAAHRSYQQGFFWFLQNDPRVPEAMRKEIGRWGLAKDEFTDNGNWPTQLYVREARRLVGDFVMTENYFAKKVKEGGKITITPAAKTIDDPIAVGSYALDSHFVQMYAEDGKFHVEGGIGSGVMPYPISYRVLLPKEAQCKNLIVPVCVSVSHVAWCSIRMEAIFMEMGQAAGAAAALALDKNVTPQKLPYADLRKRLLADRAMLNDKPTKAEILNDKEPAGEGN